MDAADVLCRARDRAGLSLTELALRAGTSRSALGRYERGEQSPTVRQLERLVNACGLTLRPRLAPLTEDADLVLERTRHALPPRLSDLRHGCLALAEVADRLGVAWALDGATALALQGLPLGRWPHALALEDGESARVLLDGTHLVPADPRSPLQWEPWATASQDAVAEALMGPLRGDRGQVHLRLCEGPPPAFPLVLEGRTLPVVPVHEVVLAHPDLAQLLERARETGEYPRRPTPEASERRRRLLDDESGLDEDVPVPPSVLVARLMAGGGRPGEGEDVPEGPPVSGGG